MASETFNRDRAHTAIQANGEGATIIPFRRPAPASVAVPGSPHGAGPTSVPMADPNVAPDPNVALDPGAASVVPWTRKASPVTASPTATDRPVTEDPQVRLVAALAKLQAALEDQRTAIAQWRATIGGLRGSIGSLGSSLEGYRNRLATLGHEVGQLNGQARALESWADQVIERSAQGTVSDQGA